MEDWVEWDDEKNKSNLKKHGIRFEDAIPALKDNFALTVQDFDHTEDRWSTLGLGKFLKLVVVVFAYRKNIRIISAR